VAVVDEDTRVRLLFGPYRTPRFRVGWVVRCRVRGDVTICGLSEAPIPWPLCRTGSRTGLVVYKGLEKAVRRESALAVAHWWGIGRNTVWKWRKALGVDATTEGTGRLRSEYTKEPWAQEALKKAQAKAGDPGRREKIAASRRRRPRPPHVIQAMAEARRGSRHSEDTRRRMSETHKARGTLVPGTVPWTPEEDRLVRSLPIQEAARLTGRSEGAVRTRRSRLKVPDGRRQENRG
jgi:hypothetical protein